ncbi:uncharacterized protein LOC124926977 [Impatiens glandulifera]|uniref:uncharacterized protein LOC124926977 n=1 Tax=Impatiens glandulifera TaxID=253017 RepID=UPI001FB090EC|nr:uncharacterized protein LOC124926977 [Impatiens glandulifera]
MDDALERERYQIEQIRELDSEELEIEEVDSHDDSSDAEDLIPPHHFGGDLNCGEITFDPDLASKHTYLGDVEDTQRKMVFLEGGQIINLPLFYLQGAVLFPEATLPLRVIQPAFIGAIEKALNQVEVPCTVGVVRVYWNSNSTTEYATVGTTAEIRQYRRLEDGSVNVITRGKQRFHLRRRWMDEEGVPFCEVQIIQEDLPLRTPREVVGKLEPLKNLRAPPPDVSPTNKRYLDENDDSDAISEESYECGLSAQERRLHLSAIGSFRYKFGESSSDDEKLESPLSRSMFYGSDAIKKDKDGFGTCKKLISPRRLFKGDLGRNNSLRRLREVPRGFWPYWTYRMYDSYCLAQKAADKWKQIVGLPNMEAFVNKPDLLSFHIASKFPVSESTRQELLEIDGVSYRLRREIQLLDNFDQIHCKTCQSLIGKRSDMLAMSNEGFVGAYANPHGCVHEIMTFYHARGLALFGRPVEEDSWFPGYSWTIAECSFCESQMGWLFTATKKNLKPMSFWGIRSSQVADDVR